MPESAAPEYHLVIEAGKSEGQYFRDLWRYRELFLFLAWRDILVRYKQTAFGIAWAVGRPLLTMVVFTIVFGKIAKMPDSGVPYPVLVLVAMLPWQLFASSFSESGTSLIGNANLLTKIYFPRIIMPASAVIVAAVDFLIAFAMLGVVMIAYGHIPSWTVLALPAFVLLALTTAIGAGLLVSALNVRYRDVRYVMPFVVQFGLYVSPVGFSSDVIPERWRLVYSLNPMVGVIDGFRWALLGTHLHIEALLLSTTISAVLLALGLRYFRNTEKTFADIV